MLLLLLFGLDFGRVFVGYVNLTNSARIAANFAAQNPNAWGANPDATAQAEYQRLVTADGSDTNCALPSPVPTPAFPNGNGIGSPASVSLTCQFRLITPVIGAIVGNSLNVSASAAYPIRSGLILGIPITAALPTPTPSPTPAPTPTPVGTPTPTPLATPTPAMCTVPNLIGRNTRQADQYWGTGGQGAGFTTPVIFNPAVGNGNNNNYNIGHQSLSPGQSMPCSGTSITVTP